VGNYGFDPFGLGKPGRKIRSRPTDDELVMHYLCHTVPGNFQEWPYMERKRKDAFQIAVLANR
jgi:hypothetical protein